MRLTNLFHLAETYLKLGMIATGFILGTACIGYFLIYKKLLHGEAKFPLKKLAAAAVILCYLIVVLGATLLGRGGLWSEKQISFRFCLTVKHGTAVLPVNGVILF